ncbi:MAG: RDD family protein [Planctomycetota bacterium]
MNATQVIRTPEGLELSFRTATGAERLVAFCFDALLLVGAVLVAALVLVPPFGPGPLFLLAFLARQAYFAWFEARWNGRTPGKRRLDLRVIRADGGPLTTEVVLARNLTREVELFLPLQLMLMPTVLHGEHRGVLTLVGSLWVLLLMFFPLTNRHRLRIGDLLAGTRVIVAPTATLLRDLAAEPARGGRAGALEADPIRFRPAQLEIYGIDELQVLEDVLRKARGPGGREAVAAVAQSIRKRVDWRDGDVDDHRFLLAFYAAQRRHLENRLLLGQRKQSKQSPPRTTEDRRR